MRAPVLLAVYTPVDEWVPEYMPGVQIVHQQGESHSAVRPGRQQGGSQKNRPTSSSRSANRTGTAPRLPGLHRRRRVPHVVRHRRLPVRILHLYAKFWRIPGQSTAREHPRVRRGPVSVADFPVRGAHLHGLAGVGLEQIR